MTLNEATMQELTALVSIRTALGVGGKPMLSELPGIVHQAAAIAYDAARSDVECFGQAAGRDADVLWWEISCDDLDDREQLDAAVRYLDAIGCLRRRDGKQNVVSITGFNGRCV